MTSSDGVRNGVGPPARRTQANSPNSVSELGWVDEVIRFWFEEIGDASWFARSDDIDARVRNRFLVLHQSIATLNDASLVTARPLLAAIIVLDQFSRNLFRGTAQAFAFDRTARQLARTVIERRFDVLMHGRERIFVYLPFEHSENPDDQALSVRLIEQLGNDEWTRYAHAHRAIIDRFGRFPHRNAILGRDSSADESALIHAPMGSF